MRLLFVHVMGFVFVNYVTSCRASLFRGRHGGFRDVCVVVAFSLASSVLLMSSMIHVDDDDDDGDCCGGAWGAAEWTTYGAAFIVGLLVSFLQLACGIRQRRRQQQQQQQAVTAAAEGGGSGEEEKKDDGGGVSLYQSDDLDAPSVNNAPANAILFHLLPSSCRPLLARGWLLASVPLAAVAELFARAITRGWPVCCPWFFAAVVVSVVSLGAVLVLSTAVLRAEGGGGGGFYLHLHHWIIGSLTTPVLISEFGLESWATTSTGLLPFALGLCAGVTVEGVARWSCAPLWHKPRTDVF